jgi:hypothetical protein
VREEHAMRRTSFLWNTFVMNFLFGMRPGAAYLSLALSSLVWSSHAADASTYANITVQGEAPGTEFDDWATIPVLAMDPLDNPGGPAENPFIDIMNVQLANNEEFLFVRISYHNTSSSGTILAIDTDQNTATGFDIFGLGMIGSEIGYINDFPFAQMSGIYNTNVSFTGGPLGNGGALLWPFWDQDGMDKELAIPLDAFVTFPAAPAFPNPSMDIMMYTDEGLGDITDVISYTLAAPPTGAAGDYNDNGVVDAADYTIWRDTLGSTSDLRANGDNMGASAGLIDQADYDIWKMNFGESTGSARVTGVVPEPGHALLVSVVVAAAAVFRRRS